MIKSRTAILALMVVLGTVTVFAQTTSIQQYLEDMSTMSNTLYATQRYVLDLKVTASQTADPAKPVSTEPEHILIQRNGELSKVERDGSLVIRDGNVVILIDDKRKIIATVHDTTNFASINLGLYDTVLKSYGDQVRITVSSDQKRIYQLKPNKGEIKFLEAEFDIKKGIFIRSFVELRDSPLGITNIEVLSAFRQNPISEPIKRDKYLLPVNSDTVRLAPAYREYTYLSRRLPSARPVVLGGA